MALVKTAARGYGGRHQHALRWVKAFARAWSSGARVLGSTVSTTLVAARS
jgi:hypothetical protein